VARLSLKHGTRSRDADTDAERGGEGILNRWALGTEHDVSVILGGGGTYHGSLKFCTGIKLVFHTISYL
jgi:hypothetical protein